ncbi:MAG: polymer-forming cytoskeletal protein [Gemmatimonadota bacterium]
MSRSPGFALLLSLLLVMTLSLLGLGVMSLGLRETAVAGAAARRVQASRRAEAAALDVVDSWSTRVYATIPVGSRRDAGAGGARIEIARLDSTLYLVRAIWTDSSAPAPYRASGRAGLLVRTLDPARLARAFPAAVAAERRVELEEATVALSSSCPSASPGLLAPVVAPDAATTITGSPAIALAEPPGPPAPDPFATSRVDDLATARPDRPVVTPEPSVSERRCAPGPGNWGTDDAAHPCHDLLPLIHSPSPLTVDGGIGRGVLVVHGDLRITNGARFEGLVVVRGTLIIEDGSRVEGAVRARSVRIRRGTVVRNRCALLHALAAPALDRAFRPPARWWVPTF